MRLMGSMFLQQAVDARIFETINSLGENVSVKALADKNIYNARVLEKLLDWLVCIGLLMKRRTDKAECSQYMYSNTEATRKYLLGFSPGTLTTMVSFTDYLCRKTERDFPSVLLHGIRSQFYTEDLMKRRRLSVEALQKSMPNRKECFSAEGFGLVMDGYTNTCAEAIVIAFDLSRHEVVVDLGGGFGLLAETLARKYPEISVSVLEQPHVIKMAQDIKKDMKITMIEGDLFSDEFPAADLFILCHVVENWNDDHNHILLKKVYDKLHHGGQLLLVEKLLDEDKTGPENPVMGNLIGAAMDIEGDYRTEQEYRHLLEKEGFVSIQCKRIKGYNDYDVMLATRLPTDEQQK